MWWAAVCVCVCVCVFTVKHFCAEGGGYVCSMLCSATIRSTLDQVDALIF